MKKDEKLSLSEAYIELEKITQDFEKEKIDIEKGIPKFRRALELARFLKQKISKLENEIEEIKDDFKDVYKDNSEKNDEKLFDQPIIDD